MLLAESMRNIRDYIKDIRVMYNEEINKRPAKVFSILDRTTFSKIKQLLNLYA